MKPAAITGIRLATQRLTGAPLPSAQAVVGWLGAVQAQELAAARWSLGQRARAVDDAAVGAALAAGSILRTHLLRPTWHFVLPADLPWINAVTAPRVHQLSAYYYRYLKLDERVVKRSQALLVKALAGKSLTRKELADVLARGRVEASALRLGYFLMRAELDLVITSGVPRGKQHTYARFDERVGSAPAVDREEALVRLTRRYFESHGPATMKDFMWWSSLTAAEAKRGLAQAGLESASIGGTTYWFAALPTVRRTRGPRVHLLQGYDEYIIGFSESRALLFADRPASDPAPRTLFLHAVMLDGKLAGHWRRVPDDKHAAIEVSLARPLAPAERRALDAELARYAAFTGLPPRLIGADERAGAARTPRPRPPRAGARPRPTATA